MALVISSVAGGIVTVLTGLAGAYVLIRRPIKTVQTEVAAVKTEVGQVKVVLNKVHALTNGAFTIQMEGTAIALRQNAVSAQKIYGFDPSPENKAALETAERVANEAEEKYRIHVASSADGAPG